MFSEWQIKSLIDYFIAHQPTNWWSVLAPIAAVLVAIFASFVSYNALRTSQEQLKTNREQLRTVGGHHVRTEWNGLMDACIKEGKFIDATFTYNYYARSRADSVTYEAFCYRAWSLVDFIVRRKLQDEKLYDAIISWVVAFHRTWLERNPFMFVSEDFWRVYDEVREKPLMVFQSQGMPRVDNEIAVDRTDTVDWDEVSKDYHKWVLGPWAPEMMRPEPKRANKRRNFLLDELLRYQASCGKEQLKILDFGCGPGNILEYLHETKIKMIFGLDSSETALKIAEGKASKRGLNFVRAQGDMRSFSDDRDFDVIISTNSILPEKAEDIQKMFQTVFDILKDDGRVFLILPAFDACAALLDYWKEHYRTTLRAAHEGGTDGLCV